MPTDRAAVRRLPAAKLSRGGQMRRCLGRLHAGARSSKVQAARGAQGAAGESAKSAPLGRHPAGRWRAGAPAPSRPTAPTSAPLVTRAPHAAPAANDPRRRRSQLAETSVRPMPWPRLRDAWGSPADVRGTYRNFEIGMRRARRRRGAASWPPGWLDDPDDRRPARPAGRYGRAFHAFIAAFVGATPCEGMTVPRPARATWTARAGSTCRCRRPALPPLGSCPADSPRRSSVGRITAVAAQSPPAGGARKNWTLPGRRAATRRASDWI